MTEPSPGALRRVFLLSMTPLLGLLMFAGGAALALRAFSHNTSLTCDSGFGSGVPGCSHYSYLPGVLLGVGGVIVVMAGGAVASYFAARDLGLPLLRALQQRRGIR